MDREQQGDVARQAITVFVALALLALLAVTVGPREGSAYTLRPPILIDGNGDFTAANGVTGGSGFPADPYIIEGWEINASSSNGIEIRNTTAIYVVRDIFVHSGGASYDGVVLNNSLYGRVDNATVSGNRHGVVFIASYGATVNGSLIALNGGRGILVQYTVDATITNNTIVSNGGDGVLLDSAQGAVVLDNVFTSDGLRLTTSLFGNPMVFFTTHTIPPDNQVNGRPLSYHTDCSGLSLDGVPTGQLIVANCTGVRVANLDIADTDTGIQMYYVQDVVATSNNVSGNHGDGMFLSTAANVSVTGNLLSANDDSGLVLSTSANLTATDNTLLSNNRDGLAVYSSADVTMSRNNASHNRADGIVVRGSDVAAMRANSLFSNDQDGVDVSDSRDFIIEDNIILSNTRDAVYLSSDVNATVRNNTVLSNGGSGVWSSVSADALTIAGNSIESSGMHGVQVTSAVSSSGVNVSGNTIAFSSLDGVRLESATDVTVASNVITNGTYGIQLRGASNALVTDNDISGSDQEGIYTADSDGVNLTDNNVFENGWGITVFQSTNTTVASNSIRANAQLGIIVGSSTIVRLYHNSLIDNPAWDDGGTENSWDDGYPSGGNFWSNYTGGDLCSGPNQDVCPDPDGIGDVPLVIDSDSRDRYPLMSPAQSGSPPAPPTMLPATLTGPGLSDVMLAWERSPDDGGGEDDVIGYEIWCGDAYNETGALYSRVDIVPAGMTSYVLAGVGVGSNSSLFCQVMAIDAVNQTVPAEAQAAKHAQFLGNGMRLLSVPLEQADWSVDQILRTVDWSAAWTYGNETSPGPDWRMRERGRPWSGLDLLSRETGVWVELETDSWWQVAGLVPAETQISLRVGWNLVGYPSYISRSVFDVLGAVSYEAVEGFADEPPYSLQALSGPDMMMAGNGYWVMMSVDAVVTIQN